MVFMGDSKRAAKLAKDHQLDDVGLHLNFSEEFMDASCPEALKEHHRRIVRFLRRNKYAQLLYNPLLRKAFACSYRAQMEEFARLFEKLPSHVDGHHHMHLCANLLLSRPMPAGTRVRRNFSFWPGEKSPLNRAYRALVDRWLAHVVGHALVAVAHESPDEVGAHPAEADHPELHCVLPSSPASLPGAAPVPTGPGRDGATRPVDAPAG